MSWNNLVVFFTFLPSHFWEAALLLSKNPFDFNLIISIVFFGIATIIQYAIMTFIVASILGSFAR